MARHTTLAPGQTISRSLGQTEEHNLVVVLHGGGKVEVRREPLRNLRRGEKIPTVFHEAEALAEESNDGAGWLDELIAALPVASFGADPDKVGYRAKAWILERLHKMRSGEA